MILEAKIGKIIWKLIESNFFLQNKSRYNNLFSDKTGQTITFSLGPAEKNRKFLKFAGLREICFFIGNLVHWETHVLYYPVYIAIGQCTCGRNVGRATPNSITKYPGVSDWISFLTTLRINKLFFGIYVGL